ncbi:MAG TPA: MarR family transcriptional regulator [Polyangiaceae bacterium]|jgi:DNA-binding MarR family transcriptional regulator
MALKRDQEAERIMALAVSLRVVIGKLSRRLREQSQAGDLTSSQKSALLRLERDGAATVSALARAEGVRPQSMGATVAVLEQAGLVSGSPDPSDGRQTVIALTASCRKLLKDARAAREDWLFRAMQANLAATELAQLKAGIVVLERLADFK